MQGINFFLINKIYLTVYRYTHYIHFLNVEKGIKIVFHTTAFDSPVANSVQPLSVSLNWQDFLSAFILDRPVFLEATS